MKMLIDSARMRFSHSRLSWRKSLPHSPGTEGAEIYRFPGFGCIIADAEVTPKTELLPDRPFVQNRQDEAKIQ